MKIFALQNLYCIILLCFALDFLDIKLDNSIDFLLIVNHTEGQSLETEFQCLISGECWFLRHRNNF
jgi:hypothetical protein